MKIYKSKSLDIAILSIFIALMIVIQILSQIIYSIWPIPIVPTLLHVPVIIGSILLGARKGAILGFAMGLINMINATIVPSPLSFIFTPLQSIPGTYHGSFWSVIISLVPRILIGVFPYFIYKNIKNKYGLILAAFVGTVTNSILVLSFMFIFFRELIGMTLSGLIGTIISGNSIAEIVIAIILTLAIVPSLEKYKKRTTYYR